MTARRSRSDGGLPWDETRQRWVATIMVGHTPAGKRIVRKGSGRTETEARNRLKEIVRDYADGVLIATLSYTVQQAVQDWLDHGLAGRDPNVARAGGRDEAVVKQVPGVWRSVRAGGDAKTRGSRRTIASPERCAEALEEHRDRQRAVRSAARERWVDHDLVLATDAGTAMDAANVRQDFGVWLARPGWTTG